MQNYFFLVWILLITHLLWMESPAQGLHPLPETLEVTRIRLEGNKRTRDHIILRELSFQVGDTLTLANLEKQLEQERNKVFNTQLFNTVELLPDTLANGLDILIRVDERWYIWPSIQVDFGDRNFNEWLERGAKINRLIFGVTFTDKNFRGRNEKLKLKGQVGFTRKWEAFYDIPYIDKNRKTGLGFKISYSENNEVAFLTVDNKLSYIRGESVLRKRFYTQFGVERRNRFFTRHNLALTYRDFWAGDTIVNMNPNYFGNGLKEVDYFEVGYQYTYDKRDISFYPTKGFRLTGEVIKKGLGILGPTDLWDFQVTATKYFPISDRLSSGHYVSGFTSLPRTNQPYFQYGGLGYQDNILRGFDLYVVNARSYGLLKNELRFRIFSYTQDLEEYMPLRQFRTVPVSLYFKLLADAGLSEDPFIPEVNPLFANQFLGSLGAGLDLTSFYDLVFRLEYSYNTNEEHNVFFNIHAAF